MAFSEQEKKHLLELKYVGDKIIERLQQMGFDSFEKLRSTTLDEILSIYTNIKYNLMKLISKSKYLNSKRKTC